MTIPTIAIIGGGFCGTATLIQLINQAEDPLKIIFINKDNPTAKGIAFSSYNKNHVLNVPAAKMSALPDQPDHFINWVRTKTEYKDFVNDDLPDSYLPRVIYGHYLEELYNNTINNIPAFVNFRHIDDEAVDINPTPEGAIIIFKRNEPVTADKIVLALGNFNPGNPKINNERFYDSEKYFQNPWSKEAVAGLENENVLIIGTGLTMVDNVLSLLENNFQGKIFAVSTNGFFPLHHKKRSPYTEILEELHPPYEISGLYNIFRKHIKYVLSHGISGEAVVDAVRPKTQEIWLSLTQEDKIKFMSHLRHLWGVARHRLPKEIYDQMQDLIKQGRLEIIGGRLQQLSEVDKNIQVILKERRSQKLREFTVFRVINCTGPQTDLAKVDQALITNLLNKGMIVPDDMKLGINALPDGTIIQNDNTISTILFTLGSMLKGILWESTAVPELRAQAKSLAAGLIKQLKVSDKKNTVSQS